MLRQLAHSAVLTLLNLLGVFLGFWMFSVVKSADQVGVQFIVTSGVTWGGYAGFVRFVRRRMAGGFALRGVRDGVTVYVLAFAWVPALFIPVHYVTQGYLAAPTNVLALWRCRGW